MLEHSIPASNKRGSVILKVWHVEFEHAIVCPPLPLTIHSALPNMPYLRHVQLLLQNVNDLATHPVLFVVFVGEVCNIGNLLQVLLHEVPVLHENVCVLLAIVEIKDIFEGSLGAEFN